VSTAPPDPARALGLRRLIAGKRSLREWYATVYERWRAELDRAAGQGVVAEIGSGSGFAGTVVPGLIATDRISHAGIDATVDAANLPWATGSVKALFLLNVLHHLPEPVRFLEEAQRVLVPGGRCVITDQHVGHLSRHLLRWGHHEPFDPAAASWSAPAAHELSGANGALAWIIFRRDRERFDLAFPGLRLAAYEPFSPLQYWLAGGLKRWNLLPGSLVRPLHRLESRLLRLSPDFGSFVHVILVRR
jgi:SAM-dependent methyltransferase